VADKIRELVKAGAYVLQPYPLQTASGRSLTEGMESIPGREDIISHSFGKGRIITGPWKEPDFDGIGLEPDLLGFNSDGERAGGLAWTHRNYGDAEIYFISNQLDKYRELTLSLRSRGSGVDLYDPLSGEITAASSWSPENERTNISVNLAPRGSVFVILESKTRRKGSTGSLNQAEIAERTGRPEPGLEGGWELEFDPAYGGPDTIVYMKELQSWHLSAHPGIRHYSGTAVYRKSFTWNGMDEGSKRYWIELQGVHNIAEVFLNGESCGVIWTPPYRTEISQALMPGENKIEILVSNTWANRLIGDHSLPAEQRISWTTAEYGLEGKPLLEGGLTGNIIIYGQ
jgi:hypothetical protein